MSPTDDLVTTDARIFRFGHFPAKDWGVTAEEFVAANGETGTIPVGFDPINLKHYEGQTSALDGITGTAAFSVKGDEVHASVSLPPWLEEVRKKLGLKISSVLDRATKAIRKIDLVDTPHIKDAVFFATDPIVIVFEDDEPEVEFAEHDHKDIAQMHHDLASHCMPGLCSGKRVHGKVAGESDADRGIRMIHDHSVVEGDAYCPGTGHHHGEVGMSDEIEELQAEVERLKQEAKDQAVAFANTESPREKKLREEFEALRLERMQEKAVVFADSVTKGDGRKAYPAERKAIVEGYQRAAAIDAKLGDTVTFSDDKGAAKTGSYLDAYKASFDLRPVIATRAEGTVNFGDRDLDPEPDSAGAKVDEAAREERRKANQAYARAHNSNGAAK